MNRIIHSDEAPKALGPYSQAVLAGNTLYTAGQIALDVKTGNMVNSSVKDEATQVMKNLGYVLGAAGFEFADVVKTTIYLADMNDFATVNEVYGSYFSTNFPARETVQVARLPKDAKVEISFVAVR
ncbi:MAG: RidA family protein [Bacteroidota bacterium]|nr:RidA family protein [Bacteroidota bacterium]